MSKHLGQTITAIAAGAHVISDGRSLLAVPGDAAGGAAPVSYRLSDGELLATLSTVPTHRCSIFLLPRPGTSGIVLSYFWLRPGDPAGAPDAYIERLKANDVVSGKSLWTTDVSTVSSSDDDPTTGCGTDAWITNNGTDIVTHQPDLVVDSSTGRIIQHPADAIGAAGKFVEVGSPHQALAYDHVDFVDPSSAQIGGSIDGIQFGQNALSTAQHQQVRLALPFDSRLSDGTRNSGFVSQAVTRDGTTVLADQQAGPVGTARQNQLVGYTVPSGQVRFTTPGAQVGNELDYDPQTNLAITFTSPGISVLDATTGHLLWSGRDQDLSGTDENGDGTGYCGATNGHIFRVSGGQMRVLDERTGKTVTTLPGYAQCPQIVQGAYISGTTVYAG